VVKGTVLSHGAAQRLGNCGCGGEAKCDFGSGTRHFAFICKESNLPRVF
jgi:hypothetical protein